MQNATTLVRPPRLADMLSLSMQRWVREGRLAPGDQLPTEKQLADRFGVSRAVVREAIARLKADGYVETRQGRGAFVATQAGLTQFRIDDPGAGDGPVSLREVFELRHVFETGIAEMAALRHTRADLEAMREPLERMNRALAEQREASADDDAFHRAIAAATHNPLVARFMEFVGAQIQASRLPTWNVEGHASGRARAAQEEHLAMFSAIAAGDADQARRAASSHLQAAARRIGIGIDAEPAGDGQ